MQLALDGRVLGNPVRQVARTFPRETYEVGEGRVGSVPGRSLTRPDGTLACMVVGKRVTDPAHVADLLRVAHPARLAGGRVDGAWIKPAPGDPGNLDVEAAAARCRQAFESFRGAFTFREERREGERVVEVGLRPPPQTGALYAILAHWKVSNAPATIVVPGDALRKQVGDKFLTMGLLRQLGVLDGRAGHPVVGMLEHMPRTAVEVDEMFLRCNVVVTTMSIAGRCDEAVKGRMAEVCSHLFIDEAHHVPARSWDGFRTHFAGKPVVQFTATPFRRDGKLVDGRVLFNYPLRKAQTEGYFKPIGFLAVDEFDRDEADLAIACAAVDRLEADLGRGFGHLVMARADDKARAEAVLGIYSGLAPQHEPVLLHSGLKRREQQESLRRLRAGESRIVVCVDMLGEGFDLPELKIAAIHDPHKSLAITLQFTGRFTRFRADLGDATMIANVADPRVEDALQELYAEDADWNVILRDLSEGATGREARRSSCSKVSARCPRRSPCATSSRR